MGPFSFVTIVSFVPFFGDIVEASPFDKLRSHSSDPSDLQGLLFLVETFVDAELDVVETSTTLGASLGCQNRSVKMDDVGVACYYNVLTVF